ncbi:MAG: hypothetical protein KDH96_05870 [Candidatus Riesia sp.]|nr:hypothetical protein [Candidatus Riesia sp.]
MNPQNGIIGDVFGTELPRMEVTEETYSEERKLAKYSRSVEGKKIQELCQERIKFYQTFLPNGTPIGEGMPTPEDWVVATRIIAEFQALLNLFEVAKQVTNEVSSSR